LAIAAFVLYPIASVTIPGLTDYPNHLARMHILAAIDASADLRRYYELHWTPMPYLAMDAMVPLIARIMPIYDAGRVLYRPMSASACCWDCRTALRGA